MCNGYIVGIAVFLKKIIFFTIFVLF
jgi:hypothetical protein